MKFKLEDKLQEYMMEKGYRDLVIYTKDGGGCCSSSFLDVKVRIAKESDQALLEQGFVAGETALGRIYYDPEVILIEKNPELILNRFLGMVNIQVLGVRAMNQKCDKWIPNL